jgi:anti-sigma regulatory factor (Ser/Thr protein kinase)
VVGSREPQLRRGPGETTVLSPDAPLLILRTPARKLVVSVIDVIDARGVYGRAAMKTADISPNGGQPDVLPAEIRHFGRLAEVALPKGSRAPGAARMVIAHCLTGLVSDRILPDAELLVSEVVTNCIRHGELGDGDTVVVRVYLAAETVRLEIENPGTAGVVAASRPDRGFRRDGFGLELVDRVAASWGVRRTTGTSVWFEMGRA